MVKVALILFAIISLTTITECCKAYIFESKRLSYLFYFCLFILAYMVMKWKINKEENKIIETNTDKKVVFEGFIPSETFTGGKSGYVFKTDKEGTGYYLDG